MKVGILALQGDISEHKSALSAAMSELCLSGSVIEVRRAGQLDSVDALLFPGGESTTISKQMKSTGLWDAIIRFAESGKPVMGTCAGCILLSRDVLDDNRSEKIDTLALMDIGIKRNAFGRQRESFERALSIKGFEGSFTGIFIRAPAIVSAGENVEILAEIPEGVVMARQNNLLALTFHPELADDTRVHEYFLGML